MKTPQVCETLGVSERQVRRFIADGQLHPEKVRGDNGLENTFDPVEVEALRAQRAQPIKPIRPENTAIIQQVGGADGLTASNGQALNLPMAAVAALVQAIRQVNAAPPILRADAPMFLTRRQAAELLGVSMTHIDFAVEQKKLTYYQIPHVRGRRINRVELERYWQALAEEMADAQRDGGDVAMIAGWTSADTGHVRSGPPATS